MSIPGYELHALHRCVSTYSLCSLQLAPSLSFINTLDSLSFLEKQPTKILLETGCAPCLLLLSPLAFTGTLKPFLFAHVLFTFLLNTFRCFWPPLHRHSPRKSLLGFLTVKPNDHFGPYNACHLTTGITSTISISFLYYKVSSCIIKAGKQLHFGDSLEVGLCKLGFKNFESRLKTGHTSAIFVFWQTRLWS